MAGTTLRSLSLAAIAVRSLPLAAIAASLVILGGCESRKREPMSMSNPQPAGDQAQADQTTQGWSEQESEQARVTVAGAGEPGSDAPGAEVAAGSGAAERGGDREESKQSRADSATSPMSERDLLRQQQWAEAIAGLSFDAGRVSVVQRPDQDDRVLARAMMREGDEHLQRNRRTEAVKAYASAVRAAPEMPVPYFALGQAMISKGKPELAVAAFRTASEMVPSSVEARVALATALDQSGDRAAAIEVMSGAVERDPAHGPAHERLAIWHYYLHDYATAWEHVRAAQAAGHELPPQFTELLAAEMPEPGK